MSDKVVAFHYTLKDKSGKTLESSLKSSPVAYIEGSGQIIPGLEAVMQGMKVGDKKEIFVKAEQAYGLHDKNLIIKLTHDELPQGEKINVGHQFKGESPDGHSQVFTVTHIDDTHVTMDGNHPLSGQDLTFDVEIIEKRAATKEELEHGHVHGEGGHHHH